MVPVVEMVKFSGDHYDFHEQAPLDHFLLFE